MRRLLRSHFDGITQQGFDEDLANKNWAVLIENDGGALVGFSTMAFIRTRHAEHPINVVYSGDTIVDPSAWGSTSLFRSWIDAIRQLRTQSPDAPTYWLLIVSGTRTYRLLPLFWTQFYPRCDRRTPHRNQLLLDQLAIERYGADYHQATGIVRFARPQVLKAPLRETAPARRHNRNARYFYDRNPGHSRGDELACLTELSDSNLTRAGRRIAATLRTSLEPR